MHASCFSCSWNSQCYIVSIFRFCFILKDILKRFFSLIYLASLKLEFGLNTTTHGYMSWLKLLPIHRWVLHGTAQWTQNLVRSLNWWTFAKTISTANLGSTKSTTMLMWQSMVTHTIGFSNPSTIPQLGSASGLAPITLAFKAGRSSWNSTRDGDTTPNFIKKLIKLLVQDDEFVWFIIAVLFPILPHLPLVA